MAATEVAPSVRWQSLEGLAGHSVMLWESGHQLCRPDGAAWFCTQKRFIFGEMAELTRGGCISDN